MEWNKPSAYQVPCSQPPPPQQRLSRSQYDEYDDEDPREFPQRSSTPMPERYGFHSGTMAPPQSIPSLKAEPVVNNGSFPLHSLNSLDMPHFDEAGDFQQFFSTPQNNHALSESSFASPSQHHYVPPPAPYSQLPTGTPSFYSPATPQSMTRPSIDYFSEGFPSFSSEPSATPTLPSAFSLQQQHEFDDRSEDFNDMPHDAHAMLSNPLIMTPPGVPVSVRSSLASPLSDHVGRQIPGIDTTSGYGPTPATSTGARREEELREPFAGMIVASEPKFSPDRRKLCCVEGCKSQARAFNRCKRHGGSKRCSNPGCTKSVQSRGLCIRHGGGSRCQEIGCTRASQSHGKCKMHGGGRPCIVAGCEKKAHLKRLCRKHGGGAKCSVPGCDKWAQRQGMCMTHSKAAHPGPSDAAHTRKAATPSFAPPPPPPSSLQLPGSSSASGYVPM
ncbi:hypothetical protein BBJ28_00013054 [Nothophytophthora sp. Chile5]|nr:hypothetical protein BBJ28_00013054 [Nothophytophthora sp. Chile5]